MAELEGVRILLDDGSRAILRGPRGGRGRRAATRSPTASRASPSWATASSWTACPAESSSPGSPGSRTRGSGPARVDARQDRLDARPRRPSSAPPRGDANRASVSSFLIVGNTSSSSPAPVPLERLGGREPAHLDDLLAVRLRRAVRRGEREVEARVVADLHLLRRDPARERDQLVRVEASVIDASSSSSRSAVSRWAASSLRVAVHGAAREHPHVRHEARRVTCACPAAPEARRRVLAAAPQQDHGRRRPGVGGSAWIQLLDGVVGHALRVSTAARPRMSN